MAIWCNCFISVLISVLGILSFSSSLIGCSWIAPLTLVVIVMRGLTCHPTRLDEWVVFLGFFLVCGIWEFVMAVCEFNELYDVW